MAASDYQTIFWSGNIQNTYIADILKEIYKDKVYEPILKGRKDLTIIDIGGNIGLTSYYFSQFAKQVYTLEPDPSHVEEMDAMFTHNKIKNVKILPVAIANEVSLRQFHFNTNSTMNSLSPLVDDKTKAEVTVPTISFESLFLSEQIKHVDFCKIDCEGEEFNVICGSAFAQVVSRIDAIVVELHQWANRNFAQIPNVLRDYGFRVEQLPTEATVFRARRTQ